MKKIILALLLTAVIAVPQTVTTQPGQFKYVKQMQPGSVPTSQVCLVGFAAGCKFKLPGVSNFQTDPYVCAADFTGTGQAITLSDVNGVPWIVAGGTLGSPGTPLGWTWTATVDNSTCRWFPGGVYLQADSPGATGHLVIKHN